MADHWRTPHTHEEAVREMHAERIDNIWRAIIAGAITGPLVALLFVVAVIWIVGLVG